MSKLVIFYLVLMFTVLGATLSASGQCLEPSFYAGVNVQAGGTGSGEIASGDINGDGKLDFVVRTGANISVLLGQAGNPSVVLVTSIQQPSGVGIGDFNHDGKADLVVSHGNFSTTGVSILLGNGTGNFGPPVDFAASLSQPMVVADFNNDGNSDVFFGDQSTGSGQMLLGNGTGGLASAFTVFVSNTSHAVAVDVNNDGKLDLAIEYDGANFVSVSLGDGTGHFTSGTHFPISSTVFGNIAAGDLNKDGKIDLVIAGHNNGVSYLLGDGTGVFSAATAVSTGFTTRAASVADFNGDGNQDIATAGGSIATLLLGNGSGSFSPTKNYTLTDSAINMISGDVNGDNKADVVMSCSSCQSAASIFFGDGAGNLRTPILLSALSPFSIVDGDLNNDGRSDLAVVNIGNNNISVFLATAMGGFSPATNFGVGTQPRSVTTGDLNNDQKPDLITANFNANTISILLGDGLGGFGPATSVSVPGFGAEYVAVADYNDDSIPDLAVGYLNSSYISILLGNGMGGFGAASNFTVPNGVQQIAVTDFNSDGKADLALATIPGVAVLLGNGNGGFGAPNTMATTASANSVAVSDFNGDGAADLAAAVGNNSQILLYTGNGLGAFAAPVSFTASGASSLAVADFNADGNPDLAASSTTGRTSVLLGNGAGGFTAAVEYANGGTVTRYIVAADLTGDGRPDLAVANQGSGTVSILVNSCQATPPPLPALSINDVAITEGDSGTVQANFQVHLSATSAKTVSVSFYTAPRDATRSVDYQSAVGRISFAPGITDQNISIPIVGDVLDEFDEQFVLILAYPLNTALNGTRAIGTILDNDPPPTISIGNVAMNEGNAGLIPFQFTLNLSTVSGKPVSVDFATADGAAAAGSDYIAAFENVSFSPGVTSRTITVSVNGDTTVEPDETFFLQLSNPVNVVVSSGQGIGTILDDDGIKLALETSGPVPNQAVAVDSILFLRDPFHVLNVAQWLNLGEDRNTRVIILASDLALNEGETASAVLVNLVDGNGQSRTVAAEDVRPMPNASFTQVTFRLPDDLAAGTCMVTIHAHNHGSNMGSFRVVP